VPFLLLTGSVSHLKSFSVSATITNPGPPPSVGNRLAGGFGRQSELNFSRIPPLAPWQTCAEGIIVFGASAKQPATHQSREVTLPFLDGTHGYSEQAISQQG
jgi:hypothetical protein